MIRADMIGPRRLAPARSYQQTLFPFAEEVAPLKETIGPITVRGTINGVVPGCKAPKPPKPQQPALIIRDGLLNKSLDDNKLRKAIRRHVDAMIKAEATEGLPKARSRNLMPPESVSTPQHEHARLVAKKQYLAEKLDAHARAMHPENHPEVARRKKVLDQVNQNISHLESKGITSGPRHHEDWINHYAGLGQNDPEKARRMSQDQINTSLHAHMGALAGPRAKQFRQELAGTHRGGHPLEIHPGTKFSETAVSSADPTVRVSRASKTPSARAPKMGISMPTQESYTKQIFQPEAQKSLYLRTDLVKAKGKKSDEWISEKIAYLIREEKKDPKQAAAIAYSMAGIGKKTKKSVRLFIER